MTSYYLAKGEIAKAKDLHAKSEALEPTSPWVTWMKGFIAAGTGDRDTALRTIKDVEQNCERVRPQQCWIHLICVG